MQASMEEPREIASHNLHHDFASSASSTSSSQRSAGFADADNYNAVDGRRYGPNGGASSRSSMSSLPGSVVVYPPGKMDGLPFLERQGDPNTISIAMSKGKSGKYGSKGRVSKYPPHIRDRNSPFRHPSSVRAMQMGDETDDGDILALSTRQGWKQDKSFMQSPSFSEMSTGSNRSARGSPYHRHSSQQVTSPEIPQQAQKDAQQEYPLVLLHCTLLPPTLSLPQGLGTPSSHLLKEVLPPKYWRRWKLLEDKVIGSGIVRDRGVLISHPQDAYDLLEERLLESLDLVRPRLAYGHFLGREDDDTDEHEERDDGDEESKGAEDGHGHTCVDCGRFVEGHERKWDVKVYAANGLMGAGAWEAAWREMEKVDVEVSVWLPDDVRRELENRMIEENALKLEAEMRQAEEEKRRREVYGDSTCRSQDEIDGLLDDEIQILSNPKRQTAPSRSFSQSSQAVPPYHSSFGQINLRAFLWNSIRIFADDPRNTALFFLSILVVYLAVNPSGRPDVANVATQASMAPQASWSPNIEHVPLSSAAVETAPAVLPSQAVMISSCTLQHASVTVPTVSTPSHKAEGLFIPSNFQTLNTPEAPTILPAPEGGKLKDTSPSQSKELTVSVLSLPDPLEQEPIIVLHADNIDGHDDDDSTKHEGK
ncbi:hypothetical protein VTO42DRAFT_2627 [Malbranchea cinnamomea]